MQLDVLNTHVAGAGDHDGEIGEIVRTADDAWAIRYTTGQIELEYDEDVGRLVFAASVGAPAEGQRMAIYETSLLLPLLWKDTGGLRVGLAGRNGDLIAMLDLVDAEVSPETIARTANRLARQAGGLHALVSAAPTAGATEEALDPLTFIRI